MLVKTQDIGDAGGQSLLLRSTLTDSAYSLLGALANQYSIHHLDLRAWRASSQTHGTHD